MHRLRRGRRSAQQIRVGLALGQIVCRREAERRHFLFADVVVDGVELKGGERAEDDVDFVALDELLRLGLGAGRIAAGIGRKEINFAAANRVVLFFQISEYALLHLNAALLERAGFYRKQAKPKLLRLLHGRRRETGERSCSAGDASGQYGAAAHFASLWPGRHSAFSLFPHLAGRRERASPAAGIVDAAHRRIGGYHWRGGSRCKGRYCRVFFNTSSAPDSRANRPDERGIPAPARSRTG